jgi:alkanesulfonate monooxygenase SsuD/methylene tetrahydromethanopterin reductase-like flavin-dependent oxidoreductase (luciferase family)
MAARESQRAAALAANHGHQAMVSDSTGERFARALRAYEEAAARDPRVAGCGYLAADPATRAVGSFLWFASPGEIFDFLAGPEVDLLQFDDGDTRRMAASVRRVLRGVESVARADRDLLLACFEG